MPTKMQHGKIPYGRVVDYILGPQGEYCGWVEVGAEIPRKELPLAYQRYGTAIPMPLWNIDSNPFSMFYRMGPGEDAVDEFWGFICRCPHAALVRRAMDGGHPLWLDAITVQLLKRTGGTRLQDPYGDCDDPIYDVIGDAFAPQHRAMMETYGIRLDIDSVREAVRKLQESSAAS